MSTLTRFPFKGTDKSWIVFVVESIHELTAEQKQKLQWILNPFLLDFPFIEPGIPAYYVGPNLRFETPESEKLRVICKRSMGLDVLRIEKFTAYEIPLEKEPCDPMTESLYHEIPDTLIPVFAPEPTTIVNLFTGGLDLFRRMNIQFGLGMDEFDMEYYSSLFLQVYRRNPTNVELMQLAQGNSSHCRHWEFGGKIFINDQEMNEILFQMVKETLTHSPDGSIKAFEDNGGVLSGGWVNLFVPGPDSVYHMVRTQMNHTATAETHNHPTLISPYPGAATGVGGRLRDIAAIGRGSLIGSGGVYFQTGKLWIDQKQEWSYGSYMFATPLEVLIGSIKGASGYGNPFGEPTLLFGNDSLGIRLPDGQRFETVKPIIYTCAVGSIPSVLLDKYEAEPGLQIVRIGGATRRIGVGGGAASSMNAGTNSAALDFASVQRGEPMVGRSAYNVIEHCINMGEHNPIKSIHDQGAGGASNVITELTNPSGGVIDLARMQIADPSLSQSEAWISESQELYGILLDPKDLDLFKTICDKYDCPLEVLGVTNDSKRITVIDSRNGTKPVDMTLPEILGKLPQKSYYDKKVTLPFEPLVIPENTLNEHLKNIAKIPGVAFLNYMVDHFDGSVGGRVVQGPRSGVCQLPICNYAILSDGFSGVTGCASTFIRSNPVAMLINEEATARMTVAQMLATLAFVPISNGTKRIKARLNVMWPFKQQGMKARLYTAYKAMTSALKDAGIGIDGGKDSSSLSVKLGDETVMSFPTFIIEPYTHVADYRTTITPDLKPNSGRTDLVLIELQEENYRMGGSALAELYEQTGDSAPDADISKAKKLFKLVRYLSRKNYILAGSPKMKGGLLPTVTKMALSSNSGVHLENTTVIDDDVFFFNEEIGVILQCDSKKRKHIIKMAEGYGLSARVIGGTRIQSNSITVHGKNQRYYISSLVAQEWFSYLGKHVKQSLSPGSMLFEKEVLALQDYNLTFNPDQQDKLPTDRKFNVAVLAAPGTNGHAELAYMFGRMKKQFTVSVIQMKELMSGVHNLNNFNVIAFAGGFSYGDVGGSAKGWAASILFNPTLKKMFDDFYARPDTLSFGVCNGFQLATLLGIPRDSFKKEVFLTHNDSYMFEHRPVNLLIPRATESIMFRGMEGSILPAWSAHGEGKLVLPNNDAEMLEVSGLVAVQYVDASGKSTVKYPYNPNGSPRGIAGLCTANGRHTFMMPHIERVSMSNYHLPFRPAHWKFKTPVWSKAFDNMYLWLHKNVK